MLKSEYQNIIENKPWKEMEEHFDKLPVAEVQPIANIKINTEDWIKFTVDNFDLAQQKWEVPKDHYSEMGKKADIVCDMTLRLGLL